MTTEATPLHHELDHVVDALAAQGFEVPNTPVAPGGEWAARIRNREALAAAFVVAAQDHDLRIRVDSGTDATSQVWVVEGTDYDAIGILGVYASLEAAKASCPRIKKWVDLDSDGSLWGPAGTDFGMDQAARHIYLEPVRS